MSKQKYRIVDVEQGSQEWHDWRDGGITATDAVVIVGRSPYKTPWRLWAEKVGYASPPDLSGNPNVKRGNRLEGVARQTWETKYDEIILPVCVESTVNPLMRASLDGLTDDGKPVEFKAPSESVWDTLKAEGEEAAPYKLYWCQVQHQLLTLGAKEGFLVFYSEEDGMMEFTVARDDAFCRELIKAAAIFWKQVKTKTAPEKDPERDDFIPEGDEAEAWKVAAYQYRQKQVEIDVLKAQLKTLQEQQAPLLDQMKTIMDGHRRTDYHGVALAVFESAGSVDYRKIVEDRLDLSEDEVEQYRKPSQTRHRVTVTERLSPKDILDPKVQEAAQTLPVLPPEEIEDAFF